MTNLDELFSFTAADALAETESKKTNFSGNSEIYKPSIKDEKCKDEKYRALIRFIPFVYDNKVRTTIERWECFLRDVNGENGIYVVSPKTIGKSCPMRNLSYKLYTSDNAVDKENSKKINVYQQWYALIEVVKDVQHPEFEGKHFIYQFGKKIYDKIIEAQKGSEFKDAINPFDFWNARCFEINLSKGSQKMNGRDVTNYDACGFVEKSTPIHFGDGQTLEQTTESKTAFMEWLNNDAPKINNFQWKDWSVELTEKVNANLATYTSTYSAPASSQSTAQNILNEINETVSSPTPQPKVETPVKDVDASTPDKNDADIDSWIDDILG